MMPLETRDGAGDRVLARRSAAFMPLHVDNTLVPMLAGRAGVETA